MSAEDRQKQGAESALRAALTELREAREELAAMEQRALAAEARAVEAEKERDEQKARADAFSAVRLKRANIESTEAGWSADMTVGITPEARESFAVMVAAILDGPPRATNYMEMRVIHPEGREYAVICQRAEGKTPAQKAHENEVRALAAERERDELKRERRVLRETIRVGTEQLAAAEAEAKRLREALAMLYQVWPEDEDAVITRAERAALDAARAALEETR